MARSDSGSCLSGQAIGPQTQLYPPTWRIGTHGRTVLAPAAVYLGGRGPLSESRIQGSKRMPSPAIALLNTPFTVVVAPGLGSVCPFMSVTWHRTKSHRSTPSRSWPTVSLGCTRSVTRVTLSCHSLSQISRFCVRGGGRGGPFVSVGSGQKSGREGRFGHHPPSHSSLCVPSFPSCSKCKTSSYVAQASEVCNSVAFPDHPGGVFLRVFASRGVGLCEVGFTPPSEGASCNSSLRGLSSEAGGVGASCVAGGEVGSQAGVRAARQHSRSGFGYRKGIVLGLISRRDGKHQPRFESV